MKRTMKAKKDEAKKKNEAGKKAAAQKPKPEKTRKAKGPKPNYTPKGEIVAKAKTSPYVEEDVRRLLNGLVDRAKYRIGNAEFEKEEVPRFKGAPQGDTICAVRFLGAVEGHELILSGVQPGMSMPTKKLTSFVFSTNSKVVEVQRVQHALWKYLQHFAGNGKGQVPKSAEAKPKADIPAMVMAAVKRQEEAPAVETAPAVPAKPGDQGDQKTGGKARDLRGE